MQKQAQFNDLSDSINKVLAGAISNFYKDDFTFKDEEDKPKEVPPPDMGSLIRMEEMEDYVAHGVVIDKDLSTKQRRIVASQKIKPGTIIQEVDPILAIVDKQNIAKYCSWCFRANNPKQADSKD